MSRATAALAKNTIIIGFSKLVTSLIGFCLLPVMTAEMTRSEYGLLDLVISYVALFTPVVLLGLDIGAFRFIVDSRKDIERKKKILSTTFIMVLVTMVLIIVLFIALKLFLFFNLSWLILVYVLLSISYLLMQQVVRGDGDNVGYALSAIIFSVSLSFGVGLSLKVLNLGLSGILASYSLAALVAIAFCFYRTKIHRYVSIKHYDRELRKDLLRFSLPIVPNGISWYLFHASDRTVISIILGTAANGIYAVSNKFAGILGVIENILYISWAEASSSHIDDEDKDNFFSSTFNAEIKLLSSASFILLPIVSLLFPVMISRDFSDSYLYFPVLAFGVIVCFITSFFSAIYLAKKMTKQVMITSIIGAATNLIVNIALIWFIGLWSAAVSTVMAYSVMAVYRHFDVKKYVKINYEKGIFVKIALSFVIVSILYYINNFWLNLFNLGMSLVIALVMNKSLVVTSFGYINKYLKLKKS